METEKRMIELYQQLLADAEYKMVQLQALLDEEKAKNTELENRLNEKMEVTDDVQSN